VRWKTKRAKLSKFLEEEVAAWNQKRYAELINLDYPVAYEKGAHGDPNAYQVEVELLEKNERHIRIMISVDDGGLSAFFPLSDTLVIPAHRADSSD